MEIETTTRLYALELLTTQLISEYLRSVPDPDGQASWARRQLYGAADGMTIVDGQPGRGGALAAGHQGQCDPHPRRGAGAGKNNAIPPAILRHRTASGMSRATLAA